MKYLKLDATQVIKWDEAFENAFGTHGRFKVGFGVGSDSVDNPTAVCVEYNAGDRLLEVADWSHGDSNMGATMGGDRNIVIADKPFALAEDSDCHILGVLESRNGTQPRLLSGDPLAPAVGGANRFSSFVSETGAAEEDPKPREVCDNTQPEAYFVNRLTGHGAYRKYYVHVYRLGVVEGEAYPALTLETSGKTPKTDTVFDPPVLSKHGQITLGGIDYYLVPVK